jgi:hypothetical protein
MALAELEKRRAAGLAKWDSDVEAVLHGEPPAELVAECREFLLSQGYELEEVT